VLWIRILACCLNRQHDDEVQEKGGVEEQRESLADSSESEEETPMAEDSLYSVVPVTTNF